MTSNTRTAIIILLVLIAGAAMLLAGRTSRVSDDTPPVPVATTTTSVITAPDGSTTTVTIEKIAPPSLDRKITYPADMPPTIQKDTESKIKAIISSLRDNPRNPAFWNDLGLYRKLLGDFVGAREAWEYAALLLPTWSPPTSNLANLYAAELRDFAKAEAYYNLTIQNDPAILDYYYQAFAFLHSILKNDVKARAILDLGIKNNPNERARFEEMRRELK